MKWTAAALLALAMVVSGCADRVSRIATPSESTATTADAHSALTAGPLIPTTVPNESPPETLPYSPRPSTAGSVDGLSPAWPQLHATVHLKTQRVTAGTSIEGDLLVTNDGHESIARAPAGSCSADFVVVLDSRTYKPVIAWPAMGCEVPWTGPQPVWPPGLTKVSFTVSTTYSSCGGLHSAVPCPSHGFPPLPPGTYHTFVAAIEMALPQPAPVTVTLTA
jgi:hypothetical protein